MVKRRRQTRRQARRERAEDYCLECAVERGLIRCTTCGKPLTLEEARASEEEDDVA
jgi:hypothetical protein